jgi:hypothetical protein
LENNWRASFRLHFFFFSFCILSTKLIFF